MYSNCLFCSAKLGKNRALEHMAVGRRVAFDLGKGRLWAVCPRCGRWNLCPFDERWEVLEECARLSETALLQESTGEISLLRHRSGLSLISVGGPSLKELVRWRFARNLLRRRQTFLIAMAAATVIPTASIWGAAIGGGVLSALYSVYMGIRIGRDSSRPIIDLTTRAGTRLQVPTSALRGLCYASDQSKGTVVRVRTTNVGFQEVDGNDAVVLLARAMPLINEAGGTTASAFAAADAISERGGTEGFLASIAANGELHRRSVLSRPFNPDIRVGAIIKFPPAIRLGLEAATHLGQEERVLSGEMEGVLAEWRSAEELAEISDRLLEPPGWEDFKRRHGSDGSSGNAV